MAPCRLAVEAMACPSLDSLMPCCCFCGHMGHRSPAEPSGACPDGGCPCTAKLPLHPRTVSHRSTASPTPQVTSPGCPMGDFVAFSQSQGPAYIRALGITCGHPGPGGASAWGAPGGVTWGHPLACWVLGAPHSICPAALGGKTEPPARTGDCVSAYVFIKVPRLGTHTLCSSAAPMHGFPSANSSCPRTVAPK